jgi:hypothetical protein
MPFGAIATIIAGGVAAGGAVVASKISSNAQKNAQKAAEQSPLALAQKAAIDQQTAYGKTAGDAGTALMPQYTQGVNYLSDYWKSVLNPDNAEALKSIAPLVQASKASTTANLAALSNTARGGGYGQAVSGIYDSQNRNILNQLAGARTDARNQYGALVSDVGNKATSLLGQASGSAGSAASALGSMNVTGLQAGQLAGQQAGNTVNGVADALAPLLKGLIFNKGTSTTSTAPPPITGSGGGIHEAGHINP